jgi:hypothetical protein
MDPLISKSKYLAGIRCPKLLWTLYNEPALIPAPSPALQARFDVGRDVGRLAQRLWPGGVEVPYTPGDLAATVTRTQELMGRRVPLFEASFLVDGRYCRVDILEPVGEAGWNLVEVKSGTSLKPEHLDDVAFQADTLARAEVDLRRLLLQHLNNEYVRAGEIDPAAILCAKDVTAACQPIRSAIDVHVSEMRAVIAGARPDTPIGPHCNAPSPCVLKDACWDWLPAHNVTTLHGARSEKSFARLAQGIAELGDVPDSQLTPKQRIQKACALTGALHVEPPEIRRWLSRLRYPLYLLDFETMSPAIPLLEGTRPYQRIPFQFSLHILAEPGAAPRHSEFLAETPTDPRPALLDALGTIGAGGTVLAYNMSFEQGVLRELGRDFPDRARQCSDLIARIADLITPFRAFHLYHPDQRGSCSLKAVLPAFTGRGYAGLEIQEGEQASREYLRVVCGDVPADEKARTLQALRDYCRRDTLAMVELLDVLNQHS